MSRLIRFFDVFVSSPRDVQTERERLVKIASRINAGFLRSHGVVLNLIFWETDVHSSKGTDLQDVVNQQVGDNYDVYLGLIWSRIGSETPRARSGTVEEFDRALHRHKSGEKNLRFMFFVRKGGYPDTVEPRQLNAVQRFRERLSNEGLLAKSYATIEEFEDVAYDHLHDYLQQQIAAGSADKRRATKNPFARVKALIPDIGRRLVQGASDLKTLSLASRKAEAQSLLHDLESDLRKIEDAIADIERQASVDHAELAGDIVFGDQQGRRAISKRIGTLLSELRETKETLSEWHRSLLQLASATDLDDSFLVHTNKLVAAADHLISVASQSHGHLTKLKDLALNYPDISDPSTVGRRDRTRARRPTMSSND